MTGSTLEKPTAARPATPTRTANRRRGNPRRTWGQAGVYAVLTVGALIILLPLVWIVLTSFKTDSDAIDHPASPFPNPFSVDAYQTLFTSNEPILRWFLNSLAAGVLQTLLILITASMGAYALARLDFPGKKVVFGAIVLTLFVPPVIFLIPNYLIVQNLGWLDSIWAITIPGSAGAFGIFFLRQFMLGLSAEIEDAAYIDGAGPLRVFFRITLPMTAPQITALSLLTFINTWNDYFWPLLIANSPSIQPLTLGLAVFKQSSPESSTDWAGLMAATLVAAAPMLLLFVVFSRRIVNSIGFTGIK